MLPLFRIIAILEGISYLALFAVTMPLKYMADIPLPNIYVGNAHGILFIAYCILAIIVCVVKKWGFKRMAIFLIASLLPFATFYIERKYISSGDTLEPVA